MMTQTYEEIFEQNGKWISGRDILYSIVKHLKGKSLTIKPDANNPSSLLLEVPFPEIPDEISKEMVSITYMIPEELQDIFVSQIENATSQYLGESGLELFEKYFFQPVNSHMLACLQADLAVYERQREARDEGQLWKVVSEHLGIPTRFTVIQTGMNSSCIQGKI